MPKVAITQFDLLDLLILVFILNPILVEHRLRLPVNLFRRVLLCYVITVACRLLLCFVSVASGVHVGHVRIRLIIRRVHKVLLDVLDVLNDHLVRLVVHHVLKVVLILLSLLGVVGI